MSFIFSSSRKNITWFIAIAPTASSLSRGFVEHLLIRMLLNRFLESRTIPIPNSWRKFEESMLTLRIEVFEEV
ncbi:hypothetical protein Lal_00028456 [Lupinus albus]|nr:hypothetical protein Lal_00028456 [Lupinus albus]